MPEVVNPGSWVRSRWLLSPFLGFAFDRIDELFCQKFTCKKFIKKRLLVRNEIGFWG